MESDAFGLFGTYSGKFLANLCSDQTKKTICGESGGVLINDAHCIVRAEIPRPILSDRSRLLSGEADEYSRIDFGYSYLPSDLCAVFL